jgi:phosphoglucosamine mutase
LIGEDTRESSRWIAETLAGGLREAGAEVRSAGVITTPGAAYLTRADDFAAGVMISASHNPYQDNGIKVFGHSGYKLPDAFEHEIESEILRLQLEGVAQVYKVRMVADESYACRYEDFLANLGPLSLAGLKLVLDCGNGAASVLGPRLFARLGADVVVMNAAPDGRNINLHCGSMHLEGLQARVQQEGAALGAAFDGDADRCLFVTSRGEVVNGDGTLLLAARQLKQQGRLRGNLVVATVMSNLGLQNALGKEGIKMSRTAVGDKYVLEEMLKSGANVGGEQSGHIIFSDLQTTGDGLLTALSVAQAIMESGKPLEELAGGMPVFPQKIHNLRVREKLPFETLLEVSAAIRKSQNELGDAGRVIVRYSGTETLVRIMVEAEDLATVEQHVDSIASAFARDLGQP